MVNSIRIRVRPTLTALLLGVSLQGCTVGPNFVSPKADTPTNWTDEALQPVPKHEEASTVSAAPVETIAWWRSFHDPTLTSLIETHAGHTLARQEVRLRWAERRATRVGAAAAKWPGLSGNGASPRRRISERTATTSLLSNFGGTAGGANGSPPGGVSTAIPGL